MKKIIFLCLMIPSFVFAESKDDPNHLFKLTCCKIGRIVFDENDNPVTDNNGKIVIDEIDAKVITVYKDPGREKIDTINVYGYKK